MPLNKRQRLKAITNRVIEQFERANNILGFFIVVKEESTYARVAVLNADGERVTWFIPLEGTPNIISVSASEDIGEIHS